MNYLWTLSSPAPPPAADTPSSCRDSAPPRTAVVVGAGLVGVATAYYLLERGFSVTVVDKRGEEEVERRDGVGSTALCPLSLPPWAAMEQGSLPLAAGQLLWNSLFGGLGAPTRLTHEAVVQPGVLWAWGRAAFRSRGHPTGMAARASHAALLGRYSIQTYEELITNRPELATCNYASGGLHLFASFDDVSTAYNRLAPARAVGLEVAPLGNIDKLMAVEPFLGRVKTLWLRCEGGLYSAGSITASQSGLAAALRQHLNGRSVRFVYDTAVTGMRWDGEGVHVAGLTTDKGEALGADVYVMASASAATRLSVGLGVCLPLLSFKQYSISFPWKGPPDVALYTSLFDVKKGLCVSPAGHRTVVVSGFADVTGGPSSSNSKTYSSSSDTLRHRGLLESAKAYFDDLLDIPATVTDEGVRARTVRRWVAPDGLPCVGHVAGGVYFNVGHVERELALSCGTARLVAAVAAHSDQDAPDGRLCSPRELADSSSSGGSDICSAAMLSPWRFTES